MTKEAPPPSDEEWERLPIWVRLRIGWWVWSALHPCPPAPVHFSIITGMCMVIIALVVPNHPMAIPIVIGGGLSGGLLLMGGIYGK